MTDARRRFTLERMFDATLEEVWALWTTKDGIEAWWGPEGFRVTVRELDLRVGGELRYDMTATGPLQIAFMEESGLPLTTESRGSYREVVPLRRLGFALLADFVPDVSPYEVETVVELERVGARVRMVLTFDAMHDAHWTDLARRGHESELDKLATLIEARRA